MSDLKLYLKLIKSKAWIVVALGIILIVLGILFRSDTKAFTILISIGASTVVCGISTLVINIPDSCSSFFSAISDYISSNAVLSALKSQQLDLLINNAIKNKFKKCKVDSDFSTSLLARQESLISMFEGLYYDSYSDVHQIEEKYNKSIHTVTTNYTLCSNKKDETVEKAQIRIVKFYTTEINAKDFRVVLFDVTVDGKRYNLTSKIKVSCESPSDEYDFSKKSFKSMVSLSFDGSLSKEKGIELSGENSCVYLMIEWS